MLSFHLGPPPRMNFGYPSPPSRQFEPQMLSNPLLSNPLLSNSILSRPGGFQQFMSHHHQAPHPAALFQMQQGTHLCFITLQQTFAEALL